MWMTKSMPELCREDKRKDLSWMMVRGGPELTREEGSVLERDREREEMRERGERERVREGGR